MAKVNLETVKTYIEIAQKASLSFLQPELEQKTEKALVVSKEQKRINAIENAIHGMNSICSRGKKEVANLLRVALELDIKYDHNSSHNRGMFTSSPFEVIVPTKKDCGFAIGRAILVIKENDRTFMRGNGSISTNSYFKDEYCRKANHREIEQFYALFLAEKTISLNLSPEFIKIVKEKMTPVKAS